MLYMVHDRLLYLLLCLSHVMHNTKNKQQKLHICTTGFLINLWSFLLFKFAY